jgi:hypothetical protein
MAVLREGRPKEAKKAKEDGMHFMSPVSWITLLRIRIGQEIDDENVPSVKAALDFLRSRDLIKPAEDGEWDTTSRGRAFVQMIGTMPLPEPPQGWINPLTGEPIDNI